MGARADAITSVIEALIARVSSMGARRERLSARVNDPAPHVIGVPPTIASMAPRVGALARSTDAMTPGIEAMAPSLVEPARWSACPSHVSSRVARLAVPRTAKVSMRSRVPDELLDPAKCSALFLRLTRYAFACLRHTSWDDAKDVAQGALQRTIDPDYQEWDREKEPELFRYLAQHVTNIVVSEYRRKRRRGLVGESESEEAEDARLVGIMKKVRAELQREREGEKP
jgi:hypothetical protein